tara:strand:- start:268 stop:939 length:672 start_codon:yes stop_codon:yes gene_type:complete
MSISLTTGEQLGEDGKEGITYVGTLKKRYTGEAFGVKVSLRRGERVAVKTFRKAKSVAKMRKEAEFQQQCASAEVSPRVYEVDNQGKRIIMQMLDTLPAETYRGSELPEDLQYQLCALMHRMDDLGIMHNDGLARNVMLDTAGRPYMIDFGFAKKIDAKVKKKFGEHPNIKVTLWSLIRGFKRFQVTCKVMDACVKAEDKSTYFEKGEELLLGAGHRRKRRKR